MTNNDLGRKLREARDRVGMSLAQVEKSTERKFKASIIGAYERGERAITVVKFVQLCEVYGTDPTVILAEESIKLSSPAQAIQDLIPHIPLGRVAEKMVEAVDQARIYE